MPFWKHVFLTFSKLRLNHFPLEKFLKKHGLLKKSCLKSQNKQLFFSNYAFLRNFSKGKWFKRTFGNCRKSRFLNGGTPYFGLIFRNFAKITPFLTSMVRFKTFPCFIFKKNVTVGKLYTYFIYLESFRFFKGDQFFWKNRSSCRVFWDHFFACSRLTKN